ncbi:MAG: hypothetical protein KC561_12325, partial [Myxococcales bacterium]|nr:hypothetical protein [Myxococcales bacterium]
DDPNNGGADVNPGEDETCNGIDDNCDNQIDEDIAPRSCSLEQGVCAGAIRSCVDGAFQDCVEDGLYGEDYEPVAQNAESCDGLDNNCNGGYGEDATPLEIDSHCEPSAGLCIFGITPPQECGSDAGICQRGVAFCQEDGTMGDCVVADAGDDCESDDDCDEGGVCVEEGLEPSEDIFDDCDIQSDAACNRSVCRYTTGSTSCTTSSDCGAEESCVNSVCETLVVGEDSETCNGLDDDCDGQVDEGQTCAPCPFGMVLIDGDNPFCMDIYEASRPDATSSSEGVEDGYAYSRPGVMPWLVSTPAEAEDACLGRGDYNGSNPSGASNPHVPVRRLCQFPNYQDVCTTFPYGDTVEAGTCNDSSEGSGVEVTGSHEECVTEDGVFDLAGNVAELIEIPSRGTFGGHAGLPAEQVTCSFSTFSGDVPDNTGFRCCYYFPILE